MQESHASALEVIAKLHALGATYVKVDDLEVKFDRVFVPLNSVPSSTIDVELDGDNVSMSAGEVQAMRDELEVLREMRRAVEALGVI